MKRAREPALRTGLIGTGPRCAIGAGGKGLGRRKELSEMDGMSNSKR